MASDIRLKWADMKKLLDDNQNIMAQWIEKGNTYCIVTKKGHIIATCIISQADPADPDLIDWEANYKQ